MSASIAGHTQSPDGRQELTRYFAVMGLSSLLTLMRSVVLALVLAVNDFGVYAMAVALGAFVANAISFGRIEATLKQFPRLWHDGRSDETVRHSDVIARQLAGRAVALAVPLWMAAALWKPSIAVSLAAGIAAFAIGMSWTTIYASTLRASGCLRALGIATFLRAILALVLAIVGGFLLDWRGAILGEIVGAVVGAVVMRRLAVRRAQEPAGQTVDDHEGEARRDQPETGGLTLYWSNLLLSIPLYFDRVLVAATSGLAASGAYSFLLLFSVVASTMLGILVQKVGPDIVRMEREQQSVRAQVLLVSRWGGAAMMLFVIGLAAAGCGLFIWPAPWLAEKYALDGMTFACAGVLSVLHVTVLLDWILISRDRERDAFIAALGYVIGFGLAGVALLLSHGSLIVFLVGMIFARLIQIGLQVSAISRIAAASNP